MKHIKRTAVIFLVAALLLSSLLAGCAAPKSVYEPSVIESSAKAAAKERVKTEISNNYKTFKIAKEAEDLVLENVENDGMDWSVSGKVTVTNRSDAADVQTVDFSISLHLIDYVGQPTPTFKLTEFTMGDIVVPEK